ncbi:MAG: Gluconate 2-dehydrogenase subunit 3 precursor [Bryobacterales bacterium]|nr:Gluconate 2-dehydrogenase subunit 3 precursor [Bryobacterales bacterium]
MSTQDESRREALKIIGAIGGTCAFPFASNELYGQQVTPVTPPQEVHQHAGPPQRPAAVAGPVKPGYFSPEEFAIVSRISDLIIPKTHTAGAVEAGVPAYIDAVVGANKSLQQICKAGFALPDAQRFAQLPEARQIALLTEWSRGGNGAGAKFFQLMKNLTADGYYTSYTGLVEELGYNGNTARASYPVSTIPEH